MKRVLSVLLLLVLLFASTAFAAGGERILYFGSFVAVRPAGDMTVTETIQVVSEGRQIKRGIYRDFPTRYQDRYGNTVQVDFEVQAVLRDNRPEPWRTEDQSNGVRIYIGDKNVLLRPGVHTYTLTYRTNRQLGFFDRHDELYWNVTGNGWDFPIESAIATVALPPGAGVLSTAAYTGRYGQKGQDFVTSVDNLGRTVFQTTRRLNPREGLTVVVMWPKGFVREPTRIEKTKAFLSDNGGTVAGTAGIALLLLYYFLVWLRIGKDPEGGAVIPLYEAPEGLSPAAVRYIRRMGFDHRAFAAAVVNMAVKGFLTIREDEAGEYSLAQEGAGHKPLSRDEVQIAKQLFPYPGPLAIRTENHAILRRAIREQKKNLALEYEKHYFLTNRSSLIPGILLSVLILAAIVVLGRNRFEAAFLTVWLTGWTAGCSMIVYVAYRAWQSVWTATENKLRSLLRAVFFSLFSLPFLGAELFGLWAFSDQISFSAVFIIFLVILLNILFYHLMKSYTIKGRRTMDQIEGLKLYLSVAEKDRMNLLNPPEKTPEVFEKFLPYALALEVEQEWCEQFAAVLAAAQMGVMTGAGVGYSPSWYTGSHFSTDGLAGLGTSLGSLSSSISSSSAAPGSGSGGGGGGSSGGGGGGGGGGGW